MSDNIVGTAYTNTRNTLVPSSSQLCQSDTTFLYCVSASKLSNILVNAPTDATIAITAKMNNNVFLFHALPCAIKTNGIINNAL